MADVEFTANPRLEALIRAAAGEVVRDIAEDIADDARRLVPVDTGRLRAGIHVEHAKDGDAHVVSSRVDEDGEETKVPVYVEYGTRNMAAQPYLRPAAYRRRGAR